MAGFETGSIPAVMPRLCDRTLPAGACDTHNHVFGPFDAYPLRHPPDYPVPLAPVEKYLRALDLAGLDRGVVVQPTQQGCQADLMLDALEKGGGRLRGVAAARADVADHELARMWDAGVVGLRFVEAPLPSGAPRPGAVSFAEVPALASRMRDLGWSIHVWSGLPTIVANLETLLSAGLPVVLEHMGMPDATPGISGRDFQTLLAFLRDGRIWVKLSVCRCSRKAPDYDDVRPFTGALLEANPDQLLWGSDWPFIRMEGREPDVSDLLELLLDWIDDPALQRKILAENPARLFAFENVAEGHRA